MKEKLSTLWAYIANQEDTINSIYIKVEQLKPLDEDKMVHLAYQLHNLYSAYEDLFKEIAITFENNIDRNSGFHKNLLMRMKLNIPDIRPSVLTDDSYKLLGELMAFRHVFRHAYNYNLSPDRMEHLRKNIMGHRHLVDNDIDRFKNFLEQIFKN